MSDKTLSQRLRELAEYCLNYDKEELRKLPFATILAKRIELFTEAIAQAEAQEAQAGELSDFHYNVLKERMIEEHRKYGDKLRFGHWADIAARKVVSHLHDMGYLRPSQAIGEQTPVAKSDDWSNPEYRAKVFLERMLRLREDVSRWQGKCAVLRHENNKLRAARPMSSEARDKAMEHVDEILWDAENCDWTCENCGRDFGIKETDLYNSAKKAISAIRG